jgi:hypothetical protein
LAFPVVGEAFVAAAFPVAQLREEAFPAWEGRDCKEGRGADIPPLRVVLPAPLPEHCFLPEACKAEEAASFRHDLEEDIHRVDSRAFPAEEVHREVACRAADRP